jgi:hypothetical protein
MTVTMDLRCSSWARDQQVDPIGTAGCYNGFLLVEWPLPWPRDVSEIPELTPVAIAAKAAGCRVQAVVRAPGRSGSRVVLYTWDPDRGRFGGIEAEAQGDPAATALSTLAGNRSPGSREIAGTDLLICGHGRRDRCCGSMGTALQAEASRPGQLAENVRVWRTSHTGGHRFAPTAIVLPEGTAWGYLDASALSGIVSRADPVSTYVHQYRGCAGMSSPAVQAVERAVLGEIGWDLLDRPRSGEEAGDGTVTLVVGTGEGQRTWRGLVVVKRTLPVPNCGVPVSDNDKTDDELAVTELHELPRSREVERL